MCKILQERAGDCTNGKYINQGGSIEIYNDCDICFTVFVEGLSDGYKIHRLVDSTGKVWKECQFYLRKGDRATRQIDCYCLPPGDYEFYQEVEDVASGRKQRVGAYHIRVLQSSTCAQFPGWYDIECSGSSTAPPGGGEGEEKKMSVRIDDIYNYDEPDKPIEVGDRVCVSCLVKNEGSTSVRAKVVLEVDGVRVDETDEYTWSPGDSVGISLFWTADEEGSHTAKVCVEYDGKETCDSRSFYVKGATPTVEIKEGYMMYGDSRIDPDDLVFVPKGASITAYARLRNAGGAGNVRVTVEDDKGNVLAEKTTYLNRNDERTVSLEFRAYSDVNLSIKAYAYVDGEWKLQDVCGCGLR